MRTLTVRYKRSSRTVIVHVSEQPDFARDVTIAEEAEEKPGTTRPSDEGLGAEIDGTALATQAMFDSFMDELTSQGAEDIRAWCVESRWYRLRTYLKVPDGLDSVDYP
jgi:hypothetical protein